MSDRNPRAPRIYFLMFNACGSGGVARTVINLANHLADSHHVELISLFGHGRKPRFPADPSVKLTFLVDDRNRSRAREFLNNRPTRLRPVPLETKMSLRTDLALWWKLRTLRPGILISTRPSLHLVASRFAPSRLITIGQDHLNFPARFRSNSQAEVLRKAIPGLDEFTVLTNADADDYRNELPTMDTHVSVIRNALPWAAAATSARLENKVVVAAGRLSAVKGFRRMIEAYEPIAHSHPDWQLHIYGHGSERPALAALITEKGLDQQILLKGYTNDFRAVLAESSLYAMTSFNEGFPMVLIEAMSVGLPLVSFDCPRGPGEIIDDNKNGRLVPNGDVAAFTAALCELIADGDLRRRLGAQALEDARLYEIDKIAADWKTLFEQVARRRSG